MELVQVIDINASSCRTDAECDNLKGTYMDDTHYERIVDYDCDFYCEGRPIFKFRKNPYQPVSYTHLTLPTKRIV